MKPIFYSTERGQALIIIALAAIGLFGIVGLAIDGSAKFSDQRHAQNAADTAALAGALAKSRGDTANWSNVARNRADDNGYAGDLTHNQVWVFQCNLPIGNRNGAPVDCGLYEGDPTYVAVAITSYVNTTFARVIGIHQTHNTVHAIVKARMEYSDELYGGAAIVGLAPDQCETIYFSGSAHPNITGGGVHSNSNMDCGVRIQGSTNIVMDGGINMVASGYTKNGNPPLGGIAGGIHGGAQQHPYPPPAEMLPTITCSGNAIKSGNTLSPGTVTGNFPPNGVTNLNPGTYCVTTGDFRMNGGTIAGTGVTIYMQAGGITWNGNARINLSAPTGANDPLKGLLIYAPMSNTSTMSFNGNANSVLTGTIFMPAADIQWNGTGNLNPSHVQIIAYTIELTGANNTSVLYQDGENWDVYLPSQVGLMH